MIVECGEKIESKRYVAVRIEKKIFAMNIEDNNLKTER